MDIASLSISMANSNLSNALSIAMIKKNLDSIETSSIQMIKILDSIPTVTDSKFDISI